MILKALHIANFKAFAIAQRVPLRPLTLIYGANSAGKSSILHALALAHHAIETGDLDTQRTRIGGEIIDLGGFLQYVHRRDREKQVELRFELDPKLLSGRVAELLRLAEDLVVELVIGEGITSEQQALSGDQVREIVLEDSCRVMRFLASRWSPVLTGLDLRGGGERRGAHPCACRGRSLTTRSTSIRYYAARIRSCSSIHISILCTSATMISVNSSRSPDDDIHRQESKFIESAMKARALGGDSPCETKEITSSAAFAMIFLIPFARLVSRPRSSFGTTSTTDI